VTLPLRDAIKGIPIVSSFAKLGYYLLVEPFRRFPGSKDYWQKRYQTGGVSGDGSAGMLARYKADIINQLIRQRGVTSVIEIGCGDGSQLALLECPDYLGVDISDEAIARCRDNFRDDSSRSFINLRDLHEQTADLTLSLDVIYHLTEDPVFHSHMQKLFKASSRLVAIYSSNTDEQRLIQGKHIRHRQFTSWVEEHAGDWRLLEHIPNKYPYRGDDRTGSFADFYVFEKISNAS
jgi:SAM-dependent methyltransferase